MALWRASEPGAARDELVRSQPTLAPSDVVALGPSADRRAFGGRVLTADASEVTLVDAFSRLILRRGPDCSFAGVGPGDLLEVEGVWDGAFVCVERVLSHRACPEPSGKGEWSRLAWHGLGARLRERARAERWVRGHFVEHGFLEVATPSRVPSPGIELHVDALPSRERWLITSPEYHMKRLLVGGVPRLFQLAHCFRDEPQSRWHEPEFTMLEWYRAFSGVETVMNDTEEIVIGVVTELCGRPVVELGSRSITLSRPFPRLSVEDAFRAYASGTSAHALANDHPDRYFELLTGAVEPALATLDEPVFLCDYPASQAALARVRAGTPPVAERFELYLGGIELCNGFQELTASNEQRTRLEQALDARRTLRKAPHPIDERFLAALEEGMPEAAGNALGFDRLIALATGADSLAGVLAFPADHA